MGEFKRQNRTASKGIIIIFDIFWWGDKSPPLGEDTGYLSPSSYLARHAGTSPDKSLVGPIHLEYPYAYGAESVNKV